MKNPLFPVGTNFLAEVIAIYTVKRCMDSDGRKYETVCVTTNKEYANLFISSNFDSIETSYGFKINEDVYSFDNISKVKIVSESEASSAVSAFAKLNPDEQRSIRNLRN